LWHLDRGVGIDTDEFGVAAIEPGIAEKNPLRTGRLMAAAAMPAMAADMAMDRGGDQIATTEFAHFRAELFDPARNFMAEDHRHLDSAPKRAVAHHDVVEADAAGGDRDPDLARPRLARRHIGDAQDIRGTGSFDDDGAHLPFPLLSSPRASRR
jgi:hypothetical protein